MGSQYGPWSISPGDEDKEGTSWKSQAVQYNDENIYLLRVR